MPYADSHARGSRLPRSGRHRAPGAVPRCAVRGLSCAWLAAVLLCLVLAPTARALPYGDPVPVGPAGTVGARLSVAGATRDLERTERLSTRPAPVTRTEATSIDRDRLALGYALTDTLWLELAAGRYALGDRGSARLEGAEAGGLLRYGRRLGSAFGFGAFAGFHTARLANDVGETAIVDQYDLGGAASWRLSPRFTTYGALVAGVVDGTVDVEPNGFDVGGVEFREANPLVGVLGLDVRAGPGGALGAEVHVGGEWAFALSAVLAFR